MFSNRQWLVNVNKIQYPFRQKWDEADEQHCRWLPFTSSPQQLLATNAHFEETRPKLQRIKSNAWKYTPNNKCYFLQWTPSPVKTILGEWLLPACYKWISPSLLQHLSVDGRHLTHFEGVLHFPLIEKLLEIPLKFYILPFCLYSCSEHLFLSPFTTSLQWKTVIRSHSAELHHPTTLSAGWFVEEVYSIHWERGEFWTKRCCLLQIYMVVLLILNFIL